MDIFKIVVDIIFSISALIVSILVFRIYKKQATTQIEMLGVSKTQKDIQQTQKDIQQKELEYLDKQIMLQKLNFEPRFQIKSELKKTVSETFYDTEFISIENDGYYISEFKSSIETFYILKDYDKNLFKETSFLFPINGFYACGSNMSSSSETNQKGELVTRFDFKNNLYFNNLYQETLLKSNNQNNYSLFYLSFIKISYKDYENTAQIKYFCKEGAAYEISKEEYDKRKAVPKNLFPVEYSSLNFEKVIALRTEFKT